MPISPKWRCYKDSPFLRNRWEEMFPIHGYVPWRTYRDDEFKEAAYPLILSKPVFRTLLTYGHQNGCGMSLFGLAALFRMKPREVWEQVKREAMNEGSYCGTTKLFVIDVFSPWGGSLEDLEPLRLTGYDSQKEDYDFAAEEECIPTFEEMFKAYPLRKCRVSFNPHGTDVHLFTRQDISNLRKTYTLGLNERQARAYLL